MIGAFGSVVAVGALGAHLTWIDRSGDRCRGWWGLAVGVRSLYFSLLAESRILIRGAWAEPICSFAVVVYADGV